MLQLLQLLERRRVIALSRDKKAQTCARSGDDRLSANARHDEDGNCIVIDRTRSPAVVTLISSRLVSLLAATIDELARWEGEEARREAQESFSLAIAANCDSNSRTAITNVAPR